MDNESKHSVREKTRQVIHTAPDQNTAGAFLSTVMASSGTALELRTRSRLERFKANFFIAHRFIVFQIEKAFFYMLNSPIYTIRQKL